MCFLTCKVAKTVRDLVDEGDYLTGNINTAEIPEDLATKTIAIGQKMTILGVRSVV